MLMEVGEIGPRATIGILLRSIDPIDPKLIAALIFLFEEGVFCTPEEVEWLILLLLLLLLLDPRVAGFPLLELPPPPAVEVLVRVVKGTDLVDLVEAPVDGDCPVVVVAPPILDLDLFLLVAPLLFF